MSTNTNPSPGVLVVATCLAAAVMIATLSPAVAQAGEDTVTVISGGGAEVQSLETYRSKGAQLYFSFSPLSSYVVPNSGAAPSPYLSGWNHLAPSRYWSKKIDQRGRRARHTLGYVGDGSRWPSKPSPTIDWSKLQGKSAGSE